MKLTYIAHSCFRIEFQNGPVLVTDPYDESVTYPPCREACDAALVSHDHFDHNHTASLTPPFEIIKAAGSYEVKGASVEAIPSFHDREKGAKRGRNLIFRAEKDGLSIAHLGDLGHMPDEKQLKALENLDILLIPIGGTYTVDTDEAEEIVRLVKPRVTVAMHFQTKEYGDCFTTEEKFAKDMNAAYLPRTIEITKENIGDMPAVIVMAHN